MKAIMVSMFVLLLNISASIVNAVNTADTLYFSTIQPYAESYDDVKQEVIRSQSYFQNTGVQDTNQLTFGDYIFAFFKFIFIIGKGVIAVPWLLDRFGITNFDLKVFISFITYTIYLLGLYQFIANRAGKSMY